MLTEEEILEVEKYRKKSLAVGKLMELYAKSQNDPTEKLKNEMKEMAAVIADDFKTIRTEGEKITHWEGAEDTSNLKILGSNKDDKLFERIIAIFDKSPKIYEAISSGEKRAESEKAPTRRGHENKPIV